MPCFYCGKRISLMRQLADPDFCSAEHRGKYNELTRMALSRLAETGEQMAAAAPKRRRHMAALVEEPALPTPPVADLVAQHVAPVRMAGQPSLGSGFLEPAGGLRLVRIPRQVSPPGVPLRAVAASGPAAFFAYSRAQSVRAPAQAAPVSAPELPASVAGVPLLRPAGWAPRPSGYDSLVAAQAAPPPLIQQTLALRLPPVRPPLTNLFASAAGEPPPRAPLGPQIPAALARPGLPQARFSLFAAPRAIFPAQTLLGARLTAEARFAARRASVPAFGVAARLPLPPASCGAPGLLAAQPVRLGLPIEFRELPAGTRAAPPEGFSVAAAAALPSLGYARRALLPVAEVAPVSGLSAAPAPDMTQVCAGGFPSAPPLPPGVPPAAAPRLAGGATLPYEWGLLTQARSAWRAEHAWATAEPHWDIACWRSALWRLRLAGAGLYEGMIPPARTELLAFETPAGFAPRGVAHLAPQAVPLPRPPGLPLAPQRAGKILLAEAPLAAVAGPGRRAGSELRVTHLAPSPAFPIGKPLYLGWAAIRLHRALGRAAPLTLEPGDAQAGRRGAFEAPVPGFRMVAWLFTHAPAVSRVTVPVVAPALTLGPPHAAQRVCFLAAGFQHVSLSAPTLLLPVFRGRLVVGVAEAPAALVEPCLSAAAPWVRVLLPPVTGARPVQPAPAAPCQAAGASWTSLEAASASRRPVAPAQLREAPSEEEQPPLAADALRSPRALAWAALKDISAVHERPAMGPGPAVRVVAAAGESSLITGRWFPVELPQAKLLAGPRTAAVVPRTVSAVRPAPLASVSAAGRLTTGSPAGLPSGASDRTKLPAASGWRLPFPARSVGSLRSAVPAVGTFAQPHQTLATPAAMNPAAGLRPVLQAAFESRALSHPLPPNLRVVYALGSTPYVALPLAGAIQAAAKLCEPLRLLFPPGLTALRRSWPVLNVTGDRRLLLGSAGEVALRALGGRLGVAKEAPAQVPARAAELGRRARAPRPPAPLLRSAVTHLGLVLPPVCKVAFRPQAAPAAQPSVAVHTACATPALGHPRTLGAGSIVAIAAPLPGDPREAVGVRPDQAPLVVTEPARLPAPRKLAGPVLVSAAMTPPDRSRPLVPQGATLGRFRWNEWEAVGREYASARGLRSRALPVRWSSAGHWSPEAPRARPDPQKQPRETAVVATKLPVARPTSSGVAGRAPLRAAPPAEIHSPAPAYCSWAAARRTATGAAAAIPGRPALPAGVAPLRTAGLQAALPAQHDVRPDDRRARLKAPPGCPVVISALGYPSSTAGAGCAYDLHWPLAAPVEPAPLHVESAPWTQPEEAPVVVQAVFQARPLAPIRHRFERLPLEVAFPLGGVLGSFWRAAPRLVGLPVVVLLLLLAAGLLIRNSGAAASIRDGVQQRAAVSVEEDFTSGLGRWMGSAGAWTRDPTGYVEVGSLALLRSSLGMTDYRLEFMGQIPQQSLGWVFRARDPQNYYAMKIAVLKPGPLPTMALVRYEVMGGQAGQRVQVPLRVMLYSQAPFRVLLRVNGSDFTTFINGQLVDFWGDDRLKVGGVGFFGEKQDRARLYWVRIAHQDDLLGRLCSFLAPSNLESSDGSPK